MLLWTKDEIKSFQCHLTECCIDLHPTTFQSFYGVFARYDSYSYIMIANLNLCVNDITVCLCYYRGMY